MDALKELLSSGGAIAAGVIALIVIIWIVSWVKVCRLRLDYQSEVDNGTSFVPNVNLQWPLTVWTLRLAVEHRVRTDNHVTIGELSLVF